MYNFTTPIPAGDTTPFEFIAYGDYGISPLPFQATTTSKLVPREVVQRRSKFVLHLGDLAYSNGWVSEEVGLAQLLCRGTITR